MRSCDACISGDIALRTLGARHGGSRPAPRSVPLLAALHSWTGGLDHCSVRGVKDPCICIPASLVSRSAAVGLGALATPITSLRLPRPVPSGGERGRPGRQVTALDERVAHASASAHDDGLLPVGRRLTSPLTSGSGRALSRSPAVTTGGRESRGTAFNGRCCADKWHRVARPGSSPVPPRNGGRVDRLMQALAKRSTRR